RPGACSAESGAASALSAPNCCRLDEALATPRRLRAYCLDCGRLALGSSELAACATHRLLPRLPKRRLLAPTGFLPALTARQSSQYFFSPPSLAYLLRLVRRLRCQRLVCVGCPRLHEAARYAIGGRRCRSLLLDADLRLAEFFPDCLAFNMFNAAFLRPDGRDRFVSWLAAKRRSDSVCLIVADPPFGGLLTPLMDCLQHLADLAAAAGHCEVFTAVAAPYYLGKRWLRPRLSLHDCQLTYANHAKLRSASVSAVRLFSNVPESRLPPPPGTSWCSVCARHSAHWNPHCAACGTCATLHPPARLHCQRCNRCVKAKYIDSHGCRSGLSAKEN
uniref:CTCHY-type domain-containing protein n=1 Tax=Macrostomum lignano TaxID=282301 RepID=A0A1I8H523_9PLAT